MSDPERYRQAARRVSTARRYARGIEHFEREWGGFLPATQVSVARYLADQAERLSPSTLRTHLAALAHWHQQHGFLDPTKAPVVREVLRGIQALHTRPPRQAEPLQLQELEACIEALVKEGQGANPQSACARAVIGCCYCSASGVRSGVTNCAGCVSSTSNWNQGAA
jgi:hypothetical protein